MGNELIPQDGKTFYLNVPEEKKLLLNSILSGYASVDQLYAIPTRERLGILARIKTPSQFIKERVGRKGMKYKYVEGKYIKSILNYFFPGEWGFIRDSFMKEGDQIVVGGTLIIHCNDGDSLRFSGSGGSIVKRYDNGPQKGEIIDLSDNVQSAETDCLKQCAKNAGVAADVANMNAIKENGNGYGNNGYGNRNNNSTGNPMGAGAQKNTTGTPGQSPVQPSASSTTKPGTNGNGKITAYLEEVKEIIKSPLLDITAWQDRNKQAVVRSYLNKFLGFNSNTDVKIIEQAVKEWKTEIRTSLEKQLKTIKGGIENLPVDKRNAIEDIKTIWLLNPINWEDAEKVKEITQIRKDVHDAIETGSTERLLKLITWWNDLKAAYCREFFLKGKSGVIPANRCPICSSFLEDKEFNGATIKRCTRCQYMKETVSNKSVIDLCDFCGSEIVNGVCPKCKDGKKL